MGEIKQLAGQTIWYGLPTVVGRFLGYLLNMALPFFVAMPAETADLVQVYTLIPFLNILFSYGLETAFFRFAQSHDTRELYGTLTISLLISTVLFSLCLYLLSPVLVSWVDLQKHPTYLSWMIGILALDNLSTLAFARLRLENRPKKYAFVRLAGIVLQVFFVFFFLVILPNNTGGGLYTFIAQWLNPSMGVGFYLVANLLGSLFVFLLLTGDIFSIRFQFNAALWKKVLRYCYPMIIVGMGGMVNDVLSRLIYRHAVDLPQAQADHELGIFANIFRLALLVTIMIQAFRMAAEPFFFKQSQDNNAPKTYAKVMKFFIIACCFMFLLIGLFLDVFVWIFENLTPNKQWAEGIEVVPLLTLGNIFLGIYYNLSIWYKLTDKTHLGAWITVLGAIVTILLNLLLIPIWHYWGAAFATFSCYFVMMVMSYKLGQKHYPVPYAVKKLTAYLILTLMLFLLHFGFNRLLGSHLWLSVPTALAVLTGFFYFVIRIEQRDLAAVGFLSRFYRKKA